MMPFLLIGFHSVGKASKFNVLLVFLPDGAILCVCVCVCVCVCMCVYVCSCNI